MDTIGLMRPRAPSAFAWRAAISASEGGARFSIPLPREPRSLSARSIALLIPAAVRLSCGVQFPDAIFASKLSACSERRAIWRMASIRENVGAPPSCSTSSASMRRRNFPSGERPSITSPITPRLRALQ